MNLLVIFFEVFFFLLLLYFFGEAHFFLLFCRILTSLAYKSLDCWLSPREL